MERSDQYVKTTGISFLEFSGNHPILLTTLFERMGFDKAGSHVSKENASLYRQGYIHFISNPDNGDNAEVFRAVHGKGAWPLVCESKILR